MSCLPDPLKDLALLSADPYKPNVASRKEGEDEVIFKLY